MCSLCYDIRAEKLKESSNLKFDTMPLFGKKKEEKSIEQLQKENKVYKGVVIGLAVALVASIGYIMYNR